VNLAKSGRAAEALRLLGAWQGVEDVRHDAVLLIQATPECTYWIAPGQGEPTATGAQVLGALTETVNHALGLSLTYLDGHDAGLPEATERPGVPNYNAAGAYERVAEEHLGLEGLAMRAAEHPVTAMIPIPALPVPVVALAHRHTDVVFPIAASLRPPRPDRRPRRVLLWRTDVAGTAEEVEAVAACFRAAGASVEVVDRELTVEHFGGSGGDRR
jgi:hypothetical protein